MADKQSRILMILSLSIFIIKCSVVTAENWLVPQNDGSLVQMTEEQVNIQNLDATAFDDSDASHVFFFLYTNASQEIGTVIEPNSSYSLSQSDFDSKNPTRIVIHGWRSRLNSPINRLISKAYLQLGPHNIIVVDWSAISNTFNYMKARSKVDIVAQRVAEFIDFLHNDGNMNFSDLVVIGHSLGAHVAGIAGQKLTTGRIPIIYGLDPAYPLFSYSKIDERLSQDDADYVETIHTNAGVLGFKRPIGVASFYPNGGRVQKGCKFDWNGICSHRRSYKFFAEAIVHNNFASNTYCATEDELWNKSCQTMMNQKVRMGDVKNKFNVSGIFYLKTNSNDPYGLD